MAADQVEGEIVGQIVAADVDGLARYLTTAKLVSRRLNSVLAEDGLREDLWRVMHALAEQPGLLMGEVADILGLSNATVTRVVAELADSGLVFRKPGEDRRTATVYLSRIGHQRLSRVTSLLQTRMLPAQVTGRPVVAVPETSRSPES
jgi:DNA-binding MarR family transcriptional regulator